MIVARKKPKPWNERLKELRAKLDITQAEAAARAGVAVRTWIAWENKQRTPNRFVLPQLKTAFPSLDTTEEK